MSNLKDLQPFANMWVDEGYDSWLWFFCSSPNFIVLDIISFPFANIPWYTTPMIVYVPSSKLNWNCQILSFCGYLRPWEKIRAMTYDYGLSCIFPTCNVYNIMSHPCMLKCHHVEQPLLWLHIALHLYFCHV